VFVIVVLPDGAEVLGDERRHEQHEAAPRVATTATVEPTGATGREQEHEQSRRDPRHTAPTTLDALASIATRTARNGSTGAGCGP
jgi:hypothetical protein